MTHRTRPPMKRTSKNIRRNSGTRRPSLEALDRRLLMASGDFDPGFNGGSPLVLTVPGVPSQAFVFGQAVKRASNGRIYTLTTFVDSMSAGQPTTGSVLSAYNNDGTLDTSYGNGGHYAIDESQLTGSVSTFAVLPDGKTLVVASATVGAESDPAVLMVKADGTVDTVFNPGGTFKVVSIPGTTDIVDTVAIRPGGGFLLAGSTNANSTSGNDMLLVALTPQGTLDGAFAGGAGFTAFVPPPTANAPGGGADTIEDVDFAPDGSIYLAGARGETTFNTNTSVVMKFTATGTPVTGFGTNGTVTFGTPGSDSRAAAVQVANNDTIFVTYFDGNVGTQNGSIVVVDSAGVVNPNINITVPGATSSATRITKVNGTKLVVSTFGTSGSDLGIFVSRYNLDGTPDQTFSPGGVAGEVFFATPTNTFSAVEDVIEDPATGNLLLLATKFDSFSSASEPVLIRLQGADAGSQPNLRAFNVGASPSSVTVGASFNAFATLGNDGGGNAPAATVRFFLSTDNVFDANDTALGDVTGPAIAAGNSGSVSLTPTVPSGLTPGNYFLVAVVDPDGLIAESNEGDNSGVSVSPISVTAAGSQKANLVAGNILSNPTTVSPGGAISVTATVDNIEPVAAGSSVMRFYLSTDGLFDGNDIDLGQIAVPSVAANGSAGAITQSTTVPSNTPGGQYFILAIVDDNGTVDESNELDNVGVSTGTITVTGATTGPNLRVVLVNANPSTVQRGGQFSVFADVNNNGDTPSPGSDVRFFLSTDSVLDASDRDLGVSTFGAVAAGASTGNVTLSTAVPGDINPGSYFIIAVVDDSGVITEQSETDNVGFSGSPIVVEGAAGGNRPDLVVFGIDLPPTALPAGFSQASARLFVGNFGNAFAPQSVVRVVLSANGTVGDSDDIIIGSSTVQGVPPPTRNTPPVVVNVGLNIGSGVVPGTYNVFAVIDPQNNIIEQSEVNNSTQLGEPLVIAAAGSRPDLTVTQINVATQTLSPGELFFGEGELSNLGAVSSPSVGFRVLLSTTPDPTGSVAVLFSDTTEGLNPNSPDGGSEFFRVPNGTPAGNYYVVLEVDPDNTVPESNEGNNFLATSGPIITVTDPVFGDSEAAIGELNTSFGNNGIAETTIEGDAFITTAAFSTRDGQLITAGYTSGTGDLVILRFNSDGSLDTSFGTAGTVRVAFDDFAVATSVRQAPDGKILVGGSLTDTDDDTTDLLLVRLQSDGTLDTSLDGDGIATFDLAGQLQVTSADDTGGALTVSPVGEIFIVANSVTDTTTVIGVLKLTPGGTVDPSFGTGGLAILSADGNSQLDAIGFSGRTGSVVVTGKVTDAVTGRTNAIVGRLTRNGQVDRSFGTNGVFTLGGIGVAEAFTSVSVDAMGAVNLGGYVITAGTTDAPTASSVLVVRLDPRGGPDRRFDSDGIAAIAVPGYAFSAATKVITQSDGRIIVASQILNSITSTTATPGSAIIRLTAAGALDNSFGTDGVLVVFEPLGDTEVTTAAEDSLSSQFDSFLAASQGVVDVTEGGAIFAIATTTSDTGATTVQVAQVVGDGIDLVGSVSGRLKSTNIVGGTKGTVTVSVANSGTLAATGTATVQLFFSTDDVLNTTDPSLTPVTVKVSLKAGKSRNFSVKFVFPSTLPDGTYNVLALVNSSGTITEINDRNNSASGLTPLTIRAPFSDLSITGAKLPATITNSKKSSLSFTVRNDGNVQSKGTATMRLFASTDATTSDDDILLGEFTVKISIKAGGQGTAKISLPASATPETGPIGSFFISALITPTVTPGETNSANNTFFSTTAIAFAA